MCVKILLICWFAKNILASVPCSLHIGVKILLIRQKISCKAKFFSPDVCQNLVDLLIRQKYPCEGSLQSTYRCQNLVDSLIRQKISCKAKFFSPDVCQNLVDLLICQKYPCSLHIGVKMLLIRWFAKKFFARPSFFTRCVSKSCWYVDSPKISLQSTYRCQNLVDSLIRQKISCKAKFFSPDVYQNLVDLLIRQHILAVCIYVSKSCWFVDSPKNFLQDQVFFTRCVSNSCWSVDSPKKSLARLPCSLHIDVKILLIHWFAKKNYSTV